MGAHHKPEQRLHTVQRSLVEALTEFEELPLELRLKLSLMARELEKLQDVASQNALHYVLAMRRAIARNQDRPWAAVHTQLQYILTNVQRWRGPVARETKLTLQRYMRAIEEKGLL